MSSEFTKLVFRCLSCGKHVDEYHRSSTGYQSCEELNAPLEIYLEPWYTMADSQEVYNTLNTLAMEFESFKYVNETEYGDAIRQYEYDGNTFFKAEQLWAQREGLC